MYKEISILAETNEARLILLSGKCISFTNISEGTAFLLQGLNLLIVCKTLKKEGCVFRNIGKRNMLSITCNDDKTH